MSARTFDKILIANRGEIACRIIRTARALGFSTVAVHSEPDADAPHVRQADEAQNIGPAAAKESYLNIERILDAARVSGAQAIHPGYGFLSENADFARAVDAAGLVFIGPPVQAMEIMGDKARAKREMIAAGVPCVPGYEGDEQSDARLIEEARRIGYPIMVKASAGGGGRGMRLVEKPDDLAPALARARSESLNAFGSDKLILERAIGRARHIEFQIFADAHGAVIHLGERDCSVQRRHQKVIEEAPSPALTTDLREAMSASAVKAARAVDYRGAGTIEFLLDEERQFYFLEMNTRLQVEHPVTELITGLDLVAWQIRVALGEPLPLTQSQVDWRGHAIEARLYAEDPSAGFLPATGRLELWRAAQGEGLRIDAGVETGVEVTPYYDPLLAKIIAYGETRETARRRLSEALERTIAFGVATNADFLCDLINSRDFIAGAATTNFIDLHYDRGYRRPAPGAREVAISAALRLDADCRRALAASTLPDDSLLGFQSTAPLASRLDWRCGETVWRLAAQRSPKGWTISCGDAWSHEVALETSEGPETTVVCEGRRQIVACQHLTGGASRLLVDAAVYLFDPDRPWERAADEAGSGRVVAPMPGVVAALLVAPGQPVKAGDAIVVIEAMKMQHTVSAKASGTLTALHVAVGRQVPIGATIAEIEETA